MAPRPAPGARPLPEMAQVSHHNLRLHNEAQRTASSSTTSPLSPADTLNPFLTRAAPEPVSPPDRAYFGPGRDSLVSKPSVSEASHGHAFPSRSSSASEKRGLSDPPAGHAHHTRYDSKGQSRHSSGQRSHRSGRERDVERHAGSRTPPGANGRSVISDYATITYNDDSSKRDLRQELESKAASLLMYLSFPVAIVSSLIAGWTLVCLVLFLFAQPLRLLHSRPSPSAELVSIISPSLRLQLRLIHSSAASDQYSAGMLVVIHLVSPFVSMGVALCAWVAGCFWFFSAILGDPAGKDGHNDGKASVVGVRNWWESWLSRGLR